VKRQFLQDSLCAFVVVPESRLARLFLKLGYLFFATIEVKDTSLVYRVSLSVPAPNSSNLQALYFVLLSALEAGREYMFFISQGQTESVVGWRD
jgi:hypothetical protein